MSWQRFLVFSEFPIRETHQPFRVRTIRTRRLTADVLHGQRGGTQIILGAGEPDLFLQVPELAQPLGHVSRLDTVDRRRLGRLRRGRRWRCALELVEVTLEAALR